MSDGTLLAPGQYGFPSKVEFTRLTGAGSVPPNFVKEVVGVGPGGQFGALEFGVRNAFYAWDGSAWRGEYHDSKYGFPNVLMTYDPVDRVMRGSVTAGIAFIDGGGTMRVDWTWTPEAICTADRLRALVDILEDPGGDLLSFDQWMVGLAGFSGFETLPTAGLDIAGRSRGLVYKVGSRTEDRVNVQQLRFLP